MCQNCHQDSRTRSRECASGEVKNADYPYLLSCAEIPQLSIASIMSEKVYLRRKEQIKSGNLPSAEGPAIIKRRGEDCLSIVSSDAPSVAVRDLHVSQSEHANENRLMPSIVVNQEPAVFKSKSINGCSLVKEPGPDRISKNSGQNIVYRRKKPQGRYAAFSSIEAPCLSAVSSDNPSDAVKELHVASHTYRTRTDPFVPSTVCNIGNLVSKSESINGCFLVEGKQSDEASKSTRQKIIEVDSINDSCSSSKSDTELVSTSMRTKLDESVECSSSSVMAAELADEGISEKDFNISILRSQGMLDRISPGRDHASAEGVGISSKSSIFRSCKNCSHSESAQKMLICDNCEEAFHLFCCNPRIRRIPLDEWFCRSCSKKRHKIVNETISASPCAIGGKGRCGSSSTEEPNPIVLMLQDTEPYTSNVRCGKGFQAEVPVWSGPITTDIDTIHEPLEMDISNFVSRTQLNLNEQSKLSVIGNWLQCREVVHDTGGSPNGTPCGKWRRAPLFEVQTDNWDCFSSVVWDPIHADCAVPQELDTDQVLKQLKYIQMLRPQLDAKRRKVERRKNDNDSTESLKKRQQDSEQQCQRETKMYRRHTHGSNKHGQN